MIIEHPFITNAMKYKLLAFHISCIVHKPGANVGYNSGLRLSNEFHAGLSGNLETDTHLVYYHATGARRYHDKVVLICIIYLTGNSCS